VKKMLAIAASVIADAIRRKVVWAVLVFAVFLGLSIPALPSYGVGVAASVFREVAIALIYTAALVVALTLSATRIPVEVERRTVFNVISRDVRRWQYVGGTWLGMFTVLGGVIGLCTIATIAIGYFTMPGNEVMWRLLEAAFAVWLETGVVMAFAVMLSCSFGAITAVVGALAFTFIGHAVVSLLNLPEGDRAPWYVPSLDIFNVVNPVALGTGYGPLYALAMVAAFAAWVALLLLGASVLFGGRDL
jgi:ABC-type transport system involved in multi-copper enzyme maturation permease subunit